MFHNAWGADNLFEETAIDRRLRRAKRYLRDTSHAVLVTLERAAISRQRIDALTAESEKIRRAQIGGKGKTKAGRGFCSIRHLHRTGEIQHSPRRNRSCFETLIIRHRIIRTEYHGREAIIPHPETISLIARDENIAIYDALLALLRRCDAQRFEIGFIGKEDAGILSAKGMARIWSHRETELAKAFARQSDIDGRQHEMIQRMRRRNHGFSCLLAEADLRPSPKQFKMGGWNIPKHTTWIEGDLANVIADSLP
jgi:hypothetical protein